MRRMMVTMAIPVWINLGSLVRIPVRGDWLRKVSAAARMLAGTTILALLIIGGMYWTSVILVGWRSSGS